MNDLETSFDRLLGRQPSDAEIQELYRVRDALGLRNNDSLWLVLLVLQHYKIQYEKIPPEITQATEEVKARVSAAVEHEAKASIQAMKAELKTDVTAAAHRVAGTVNTRWLVGCVVLAMVGMGGTGWSAFKAGWSQGYQQMAAAEDVTQWALTPEGQMAYKLAQAGPGNIRRLAGCEGEGWNREEYKEGYACFPRLENGKKPTGWLVP